MVLPENQVQIKMHNYFGKFFKSYKEVKTDCKTGRLDLVLFHPADYNNKYPVGIEIKKSDIKTGSELGKWLSQALRYKTCTVFSENPVIFISPQISHEYLMEGQKISKHDVYRDGFHGWQHNVNTFLYSAFGVGEIQKYNTRNSGIGVRMVINALEIWNSEFPDRFNINRLPKD